MNRSSYFFTFIGIWIVLKLIYAIVILIVGAVNFGENGSWCLVVHIITTILIILTSFLGVTMGVTVFWKQGFKGAIVGMFVIGLSILPVYYAVSWFFEGTIRGSDVLFGGVAIIVQSLGFYIPAYISGKRSKEKIC